MPWCTPARADCHRALQVAVNRRLYTACSQKKDDGRGQFRISACLAAGPSAQQIERGWWGVAWQSPPNSTITPLTGRVCAVHVRLLDRAPPMVDLFVAFSGLGAVLGVPLGLVARSPRGLQMSSNRHIAAGGMFASTSEEKA